MRRRPEENLYGQVSAPYTGDEDTHVVREFKADKSICSRVMGTLGGAILGFFVIMTAIGLLYYNEGRAVVEYMSLAEGSGICTTIEPVIGPDTAEFNNKLVHLVGPIQLREQLIDTQFGVQAPYAACMRTVEMFQWIERKETRAIKTEGGTMEETMYSYDQDWSEAKIDSAIFSNPSGHRNPKSWTIESRHLMSPEVQVGQYILSEKLISQINNWAPYVPDVDPQRLKEKNLIVYMGKIYTGKPLRPEVGDYRVSFQSAGRANEMVSVVAQKRKNRLEEYKTKVGGSIEMLLLGRLSKGHMFDQANTAANWMTWGCRVAAWLLMWSGIALMLQPILYLVKWIPILSQIANLTACLLGFTSSLMLSIITIAISWIRFRPYVACSLLAGALAILIWSILRGRSIAIRKNLK